MTNSRTLKKALIGIVASAFLVISAILLSACCGTNATNYDYSAFQNDYQGNTNLEERADDGIIMVRNTEGETCEGSGEFRESGSTYFNEEDKNLDWDGTQTTISFDLDLKNIDEGDFTAFVLSFNSANTTEETTTYNHTYEIRLGVAKTAEGYKVAELGGIFWSEQDYNNIIASNTLVQDEDGILDVSFVVSYESETLTYSFIVNDATIENTANADTFTTGAIVGFRSLWNAVTNTDDVVLLNLQKA